MKSALIVFVAAVVAAQSPYGGAAEIDQAVEQAIAADQIPGAVVQIGGPDRVVFRKAYGLRALTPRREVMTEDTIFDAASLTKVVATTSAMMLLVERRQVRLEDPVTRYLPEFQGGASPITVKQLLSHFSGLRPDVDLKPEWSGYETGVRLALIDKPVARPGERFLYSDINFILLGEIIRRVTGRDLPDYVTENVFLPLGMKETMFRPPASLRGRVAPTEQEEGMTEPLRGVVHDPTTRFMGGVAGHAGMFTTAADLGRFAEMMLTEGICSGGRLFQPETIRLFRQPASPYGHVASRGLGWDIDTAYSANRGDKFPVGSFGHTGFTGTSIWVDPLSGTYVILLSNSVHPKRRPPISALRNRVATIAATQTGVDFPSTILPGIRPDRSGGVLTGLDVLAASGFSALKGKRVGLITNHTGLSKDGKRNVDLMVAAGVQVVALISPEHGITGTQNIEFIPNSKDQVTGIPIHSAYQGKDRKPSADLLRQLDVLAFDIQDVGARFYTYMCTLLNTIEEAARLQLPVIVLDRPNPITGTRVEGPVLEEAFSSFVGCYPLPLRHGMTLGEIAVMANAERGWGAKLEVIRMAGWRRSDWFDSTGLTWVNPSPNIRSLHAATLYPGVAMLEYSKNYSVGRGTDSPFEQIGAQWIIGPQLAAFLNRRGIPGVRAYATRFQPSDGPLKSVPVEGVRFLIVDRERFVANRLGIEVAAALIELYPGKLDISVNAKLIANRSLMDALAARTPVDDVVRDQEPAVEQFRKRRIKHLLY
jgi:uncharacterized protein YbbC (DUF1343 family)